MTDTMTSQNIDLSSWDTLYEEMGILPYRHFIFVIHIITLLRQEIVMTVRMQLHPKNIKIKKHETNL
jgi:hypothetical protein